jgi:hypothetical protein
MTVNASPKIVGGLLSGDLIGRIVSGDSEVPGTAAESYGLEKGESVRRQASRSWPYLLEVWQEYQSRRKADADGAASAHRRWLHILLRELGFTKLTASGKVEIDGKEFPVSHHYGPHIPVHLLGWGVDLDKRTYKVTARAPHAMMQELLNRSDKRLWALLSNGQVLRLLRDSATFTGQAYLEFDLQAIFDGEQFSDFVRLFLICHESRFVPLETGKPASCYLEQWRSFGASQGERALKELRKGVESAIAELGTGFLIHSDNPHLRSRLRTSELSLDDFNRSLLRVIYRLLFWFVAEDRNLLHPPLTEENTAAEQALAARTRYATYFSSARLRKLALKRSGTHHSDLWDATRLLLDALGDEGGLPELALPGLGGIFETRLPDDIRPLPLDEPLDGARVSNRALLSAIKALAYKQSSSGGGLRPIDFGNLGAEELGSVYEGLLELKARFDPENQTYELEKLPGNERRETGSYYTPTSLVECLLESTLDPLLDDACKAVTPEDRVTAMLGITVCDPACGSGHFLVAAARRIAKRIAAEETGEPEPSNKAIRTALRRVVGRCIYGVDINPMAVELTKVSLWMETVDPGKPLAFLDTNIRVGNALLGTTPALLSEGLPDKAFTALEGDDRKIVAALKKQNAKESSGQGDLFSQEGILVSNAALAKRAASIADMLPESLEDLHTRQRRLAQDLTTSEELHRQKLLADAWCAAFVQPKTEDTRETAITQATLELLAADADFANRARVEADTRALTGQYRFFHWHIEFPHLFRVGDKVPDVNPQTGWSGGFTCVLGNPPWERVKLQEQEFFASRHEDIAKAKNAAARKTLIAALTDSDSKADRQLGKEWRAALRESAGMSHLLRASGRYPKTGSGDINTYAVFAETGRTITGSQGRMGVIIPTGIATDATTAPFFRSLIEEQRLDSLLDFVTNPRLWTDVGHRRYRFVILVISGQGATVEHAEFATLSKHPDELPPRGSRIRVAARDLLLVNPNTGTCPMFQSQRDADITLGIYRRVPVLWRESPESNPWTLSFQALFHLANDSGLFCTQEDLAGDDWKLNGNIFAKDGQRMLPLYEAKLNHHFDHRLASYSKRPEGSRDTELPRLDLTEKQDPTCVPIPRYWVAEIEVESRLKRRGWAKDWLLGWRDITNATNERTMLANALPRTATPDGLLLMLPGKESPHGLLANVSAFVFDYVVRQKSSGVHLKYFIVRQLPLLPPEAYHTPVGWLGNSAPADWIRERVLELSYTAYDLAGFAKDLGDDGPPFVWDEERRFVMRAELDAAYFQLYGIERDDVGYILDSFRALRNNDPERFTRTKSLILEIYDAMAEAAWSGRSYQTLLDPPPGHGPRHPPQSA